MMNGTISDGTEKIETLTKDQDASGNPSQTLSSEQPKTNEIAALASKYEHLERKIESSYRDMESAKNMSYLGFAILLVMVAALVIQGFAGWVASYNSLNDNITRLQLQLDQPRYR